MCEKRKNGRFSREGIDFTVFNSEKTSPCQVFLSQTQTLILFRNNIDVLVQYFSAATPQTKHDRIVDT